MAVRSPHLVVAALGALLAGLVAVAAPSAGPAGLGARPDALPTLPELIGQRLVVAMQGTSPSRQLLARVRRGEVGGVILFGANVTSRSQLRSLTDRLQAAARAGGRPPLLVAVDQEGGDIRRLPWAGPAGSARALGREPPGAVRAAARAAGSLLRAAGVNVDLAPVLDVPVPGSFMAAEQRTFAADSARVGLLGSAFATGLGDSDVAATAKHFPGIGRAIRSTDRSAVTIEATRAELARDLRPFRRVIAAGVPLVMLSNATYSAFGPAAAGWSTRIQSLLRHELGFRGVTISDALEPAAATRGLTLTRAALLTVRAGVDLVLLTGSEASSSAVFHALVAEAGDGLISRASLRRSDQRILALKQRLS
jgi:beta-N-acetylhexosaminidase